MVENNGDETQMLFERAEGIEQPTDFFLHHINDITGGLWGVGIPIIVFGVVYMSLNDYDPRKAFGSASFATLVTTVLLLGMGVVGSEALIIIILITVLAVVMNRGGGRI